MKDIILKILKVFLTFYTIAITIIAIDGLTVSKNIGTTKYGIVYSTTINQTGTISDALKSRLDKAIELLDSKEIERIIVSGGNLENSLNKSVIMKKYLVDSGVKIPRILVDKKGDSTISTSKNSYNIVKNKGNYPNIGIIGITHFYHCSRVKLSLKKSGFSNINCISPDYYELKDIYSLLREAPLYIKLFSMGIGDEIDINISTQDLKVIGKRVLKEVGIGEQKKD